MRAKPPKLGGPPAPSLVVLRDSCFGEIRFKKIIKCELYPYFIYIVMRTYSHSHINPIPNVARCLNLLYREHGIDLYATVDMANEIMKKYLPSVNFNKYVSLLKKVYIPQIVMRRR